MAQVQTLAPAARRAKAETSAAEVRKQIEQFDQRLADLASQQRTVDAAMEQALSTVEQVRRTLGQRNGNLTTLRASLMTARGTDAEAAAAQRVVEAEHKVAAARAALEKAQEESRTAATTAKNTTARIQKAREELAPERLKLAELLAALEAHGREQHGLAGQAALEQAKATKAKLLQRVQSARLDLAVACEALDSFHAEVPSRLVSEYPALADEVQLEGLTTGQWPALDLFESWLGYLDRLVRHTGHGRLDPAMSLRLLPDLYNRPTLSRVLTLDNTPAKAMRTNAQAEVDRLRAVHGDPAAVRTQAERHARQEQAAQARAKAEAEAAARLRQREGPSPATAVPSTSVDVTSETGRAQIEARSRQQALAAMAQQQNQEAAEYRQRLAEAQAAGRSAEDLEQQITELKAEQGGQGNGVQE
jgi:chromosome segregation ATPase